MGPPFLAGAALGVVVCGDSTKSDVWVEDCSVASILLQMAAQSLGLGSCWIQIRQRMYEGQVTSVQYVQKLLGLPKHVQVASIIVMGYPAEQREPKASDQLNWARIS
jgi:nitroreductase